MPWTLSALIPPIISVDAPRDDCCAWLASIFCASICCRLLPPLAELLLAWPSICCARLERELPDPVLAPLVPIIFSITILRIMSCVFPPPDERPDAGALLSSPYFASSCCRRLLVGDSGACVAKLESSSMPSIAMNSAGLRVGPPAFWGGR